MVDQPVILLTDRPGVGKTTAIKKIVTRLGANAGGLYTREVRKSGHRTGFGIVTLAGQTGYLATKEPTLAFSHELPFSQYRVNLKAIDRLAVPALLQARAQGHIVAIDEIEPMELLSARFDQAVLALFDSQVTVPGTIIQRRHTLADQVKAHPRVIVQEVTAANRNQLPAQVYDHFSQLIDVIIRPTTYTRYRQLIRHQLLLVVAGLVQRQEDGWDQCAGLIPIDFAANALFKNVRRSTVCAGRF